MSVFKKLAKGCAGGGAVLLGGTCYLLYRDNSHPFWAPTDPRLPQNRLALPPTREESIQGLLKAGKDATQPLDVLIIGGGATGSGVALDLATRSGASVGLVEADDYASETSSRSTKLIHGGVRYLEKAVFGLDPMQLKLVFEALNERSIMVHQAPHLSAPVATIIPCYSPLDIGMYWTGMKMYDLLAAIGRGTIGGISHFQMPVKTLDRFPKLKNERNGSTLLGSVVYYDGIQNDARVCLSVALTAACYGAHVVNHMRVTGLKALTTPTTPAPADKVMEVEVTDQMSGKKNTLYTKSIVNATGPFSDNILRLLNPKHEDLVVPAGGTHLILPPKYAPPPGDGMLVPSPDGRVLFMLNWQGHCLAGTTDAPKEVTPAPRARESEVKFILDSMVPFVGNVPRDDVMSVWCGIRPLSRPPGSSKEVGTQNIVREHYINPDLDNRMVSITGGKWTTYRKMAEDTVESLLHNKLLPASKLQRDQSVTGNIVLMGGQKYDEVQKDMTLLGNVPAPISAHWLRTFGDGALKTFEIASERATANEEANKKSGSSGDAIVPTAGAVDKKTLLGLGTEDPAHMALPYSRLGRLGRTLPDTDADVIYSSRYEHAMTLQDFIARRSRMAFLNLKETRESLPKIAEVMGAELKWSSSRRSDEIKAAEKYLETFTTTAA